MRMAVFFLFVGFVLGCGVKGDPLPPEKAAELGRGRPTYKRALKDLKVAPVTVDDDEDEDEEKEDEE